MAIIYELEYPFIFTKLRVISVYVTPNPFIVTFGLPRLAGEAKII